MQISCPQCGRMLEAPYPLPSLAKCPFCAAVFAPAVPRASEAAATPPVPQVSPRLPTGPSPADQVRTPAVGMLLAGFLSFIWALVDLIFCFVIMRNLRQGQAPPPPPFFPELFQFDENKLILEASLDAIKLVTCALVMLGASRMLQLRSYGLAFTGSILSFIPCLTCCVCLGIPFGIWALVVLNRTEVRSSFR
jgi:hypothetical protein